MDATEAERLRRENQEAAKLRNTVRLEWVGIIFALLLIGYIVGGAIIDATR